MATAERTASTTWEGDLPNGQGTVSVSSGAIGDFPVTWASRTERSDGKTSPEELIAAAHSSCFSMALSNVLAQGGNPPERLNVTSTVTFDSGQGKVTESRITVRGRVPGIGDAAFQEAVRTASQGCPVSNALRGNIELPVDATLES
ncbi:MAG TPA: OsmC family peroxiredoxin [Solirubrobacteraceae bacterium]|jgi:lipoyl-dependent peroxiredoxin|nr:OsmC family peroxiredoxin [Solirubrobacteraceae bacterium]